MDTVTGVKRRERYSNKEERMGKVKKLPTGSNPIGPIKGNVVHVNFKQIMADKLMATGYAPVYETKVIYVDFTTKQKIGHVS